MASGAFIEITSWTCWKHGKGQCCIYKKKITTVLSVNMFTCTKYSEKDNIAIKLFTWLMKMSDGLI